MNNGSSVLNSFLCVCEKFLGKFTKKKKFRGGGVGLGGGGVRVDVNEELNFL